MKFRSGILPAVLVAAVSVFLFAGISDAAKWAKGKIVDPITG
jgi:hypothetical protein